MKIIVTGSTGNISKPLTSLLVEAGHTVTVITRDAAKAGEIAALGAKAAVGSVEDPAFLTAAFSGADAVYTMVPPNFTASDYREYIGRITRHYAEAIRASGIRKVVNLSSIGADLDGGTGPIAGLHDGELILNELPRVIVKHLRAGFFYVNFFAQFDLIRQAGIMGGNYGDNPDVVLVHPKDIAVAAATAFSTPFEQTGLSYVSSDIRKTSEIAAVLGKAIGKPGLPWIDFSDEQNHDGMTGAGLPEEMARVYTEMGAALRSGILFSHYKATGNSPRGSIKLEDFADEFGAAFELAV